MEYAYQHTHTYILPFPYGQDIPHTWTAHSADMDKNCPTDTPPDYGLFSILFPHEERYQVLIHQGTLRYFPKKNPERPCRACGFFPGNSLLHHHLISKDCLEKKRKNGGAALCGQRRRRQVVDSKSTNPAPLANRKLIAILPESMRMQSGS